MWIVNYIKERTVTRASYNPLLEEIALGADSPRARTGELQRGLRLMQALIEEEVKRQ